MTKVDRQTKLQRLRQVFTPDTTSVDFTEFDGNIDRLKKGLKQKVQIQTIDDVNRQLEKFRKRLDFIPLFEAMANLETTLDQKIEGVSGLMSEEISTLKQLLTNQDEVNDKVTNDKISTIASHIDLLKDEQGKLEKQKNVELADLKNKLGRLQDFSDKSNKTFSTIQGTLDELEEFKNDTSLSEQIMEFAETLERIRKEFNNRLANLGGGAMNRQMFIGGVDPLTRYTDMNLKAGSNVTISYANNDTTKKVDVTFASSGGGGSVRSINSVAINTAAGSTAGTDYVYLVSGTTIITMPTAVGNSNLYTIKNVGTGVVTIAFTGVETGDGSTTMTMPVQYTSVDLISDTLNWNVT